MLRNDSLSSRLFQHVQEASPELSSNRISFDKNCFAAKAPPSLETVTGLLVHESPPERPAKDARASYEALILRYEQDVLILSSMCRYESPEDAQQTHRRKSMYLCLHIRLVLIDETVREERSSTVGQRGSTTSVRSSPLVTRCICRVAETHIRESG